MKLYIFEKRAMAEEALLRLSQEELSRCDLVTAQSLGLFQYDAPKLDFKDIPATPTFENIKFDHKTHPKGFFVYDHLAKDKRDKRPLDYLYEIRDRPYDEIFIATDSDALGDFTGYQIAKQFSAFEEAVLHRLNFATISAGTFQDVLKNKVTLGDKGKSASMVHEVKRVFDFWWKVNSEKVFGELCNCSELRAQYPVSKYEIMTLNYCYNSECELTQSDIFDWMEKPGVRNQGSGKYKNITARIGSYSTFYVIFSGLLERGALQESKDGIVTVTSEGEFFMQRLHPRTYDQDLPFRLQLWCQRAPTEQAKVLEEMARYIRQLFGRQLRFQRKKLIYKG